MANTSNGSVVTSSSSSLPSWLSSSKKKDESKSKAVSSITIGALHEYSPTNQRDLVEMKAVSGIAHAAIQRIITFGKETSDHGWQHVTKDKGIIVTQKKSSSTTGLLVRGQGMVHASPLAILDLVWDTHRKHEYDPLFKTARRLYQLDDQTRVEHHIFNAPPLVSQRDFVLSGRWVINNDGTIVVSCKSVQSHACAPVKGYVRGDIVYAGFIIRPQWIDKTAPIINGHHTSCTCDTTITNITATTSNGMIISPLLLPCNASYVTCDVTFVAQLELAGSLPRVITSELAVRQPMSLLGINDYMRRYHHNNTYVYTLSPSFYLAHINHHHVDSITPIAPAPSLSSSVAASASIMTATVV